ALRLAARHHKADVSGSTVTANVDFGAVGEGAYGIAVRMEIGLPRLKPSAARELAEAAHLICPYSNATRGNISVELSILAPPAMSACSSIRTVTQPAMEASA
ncbi:MAG: OsmC family protein, partial [Actinomycetota bacterium]|nr:OsmC family protein [Actinomycetota bacterium]